MHPNLQQLLRTVGASAEGAPTEAQWREFLRHVDESYPRGESERSVLERSVPETSGELRETEAIIQQTLSASVQMLEDVLALSAPAALAYAMRIKRTAGELACKIRGAQVWPIETAALLSRLGAVSLSPSTLEKLDAGKPLSADEQQAVDRLPAIAEQLLPNIPRLDEVRAALKYQTRNFDGTGSPATGPRGKHIPLGARVLRLVNDFDRLEASGVPRLLAFDTMRGRRGHYDPELLEILAIMAGGSQPEVEVHEIPVRMVCAGMVFLNDVRTASGTLLVARGQEATENLLLRFRNFAPGTIREPLSVKHVSPRPLAIKRSLVLVDSDRFRRATVSRALLRAQWDLTVIDTVEQLDEVLRRIVFDVAIVDLLDRWTLSVAEALVASSPNLLVFGRGTKDDPAASLFLRAGVRLRVHSRDVTPEELVEAIRRSVEKST